MMKCDELKPLVFSLNDFAYIDEPAAEKNFENPHDHAVYKATEVDAAIAELKKDLEDAKATAYAESVDAGMRERRLKRALWLDRSERAEARKNYWYVRSIHEGDERRWSIDGSAVKYLGCIKRTNFEWLKIWSEIEIKCRNKMEAYK